MDLSCQLSAIYLLVDSSHIDIDLTDYHCIYSICRGEGPSVGSGRGVPLRGRVVCEWLPVQLGLLHGHDLAHRIQGALSDHSRSVQSSLFGVD